MGTVSLSIWHRYKQAAELYTSIVFPAVIASNHWLESTLLKYLL